MASNWPMIPGIAWESRSRRSPSSVKRASLSATNRTPNPSTIRNTGQQHFFGSTASSNSQRGSFNEQAGRISQALRAGGQTSGGSQTAGTNRGNGMTRQDDRQGGSQPSLRNNGATNQDNRNDRPATSQQPSRSFEAQGQRPQEQSQPRANSDGWQRFTPQSNGPSRGSAPGNQQTQPRYQGNSQAGNSRPPLDLRRPVVNDRGQSRSGYNPPPSSRPPSAPRYSPPPSRSSGGSAPRNSAPPSRGSGGSSRGNSRGSSGGGSHGSSHGGGGGHHH